jgi:hypothetical protein
MLSRAVLMRFLTTIQSTVLTLILERDCPSVWVIGWHIKLLAAVYLGVIASETAIPVNSSLWSLPHSVSVFIAPACNLNIRLDGVSVVIAFEDHGYANLV